MKIHTGDTVLIISGKDRGKTGAVLRVLPVERRVVVTGINMRTRHIKKTPQQAGRILKYEASIAVGNVMFLDPKTKKPTRIGYRLAGALKQRVAKVSGAVLEKGKAVGPAKSEGKKREKKEEKAETKRAPQAEKGAEKVAAPKKQPFWKRMGFGATALKEEAEVAEPTHMQEDHSIPDQTVHVRKGARGS